jgi:hypothetical protein
MKLTQSLFVAVILAAISIGSWEMYWRSQGKYPTLNDEKALWANHRAKVNDAKRGDIILIGSSRVFFDFQLTEFEKAIGIKPIQLSSPGSSPLPLFHDLVDNTAFNGAIIVGVTPGLFFSTTYPEASPWKRAQSKVDYYESRTYAQRLNYALSAPLQQNFVFMSADEEEWNDDIDLKSLLRNIPFNQRMQWPSAPPFCSFGDVDIDRNMKMTERTVTDTAFATSITKVWTFFGKHAPPPDKKATIAYFLKDLKKYKARGGTVILVRCPSSGGVRIGESIGVPRAEYWDDLVKQSQVKSYHFEDYDQLKNLTCAEWSHLSAEDANYFTRELAAIMIKDKAIKYTKTK